MDQLVQIMLPPLVACLILAGIHTYLGLHVVSRGVIFVDLALAQIAALGSTFAFLVGFEPDSSAGYLYALTFTFIGAAIFSFTRLKDQRIPQEAFIGIIFAVASAGAVLIADQAAQGAEHIEAMLTGSILWVSWTTVWTTFLIYAGIGLFHFIYRERFLLISMHPEEAVQKGVSVRWWDFLFYVSFGFVITLSVSIAGVLLVFCFLIVPSVIGILFSTRIWPRLLIGWISALVVSFVGLILSYQLDLPSGPSIVCTFGVLLILAALLRFILNVPQKKMALGKIALGTLVTVLFIGILFQFQPVESHENDQQEFGVDQALQALGPLEGQAATRDSALMFLFDNQDLFRQALREGVTTVPEELVQRLGQMESPEAVPILKLICDESDNPWIRFYGYRSLLQLGEREGIHGLIQILATDAPPFLRAQARDALRELFGSDFGYDPLAPPSENQSAVNLWEVWWHENADRMAWNHDLRRFDLEP